MARPVSAASVATPARGAGRYGVATTRIAPCSTKKHEAGAPCNAAWQGAPSRTKDVAGQTLLESTMSKAVMSLTTGLDDPENVTIVVASWRNHAGEVVDRRRSGNHIQLLTKEVTVVTNLGEEFAHALAAKDSARMAKL